MEENILFLKQKRKKISVYAYTDTSSHFFGSLGKKMVRESYEWVMIFFLGQLKLLMQLIFVL